MKHLIPLLFIVTLLFTALSSCHKQSDNLAPEPELLSQVKDFVTTTLLQQSDTGQSASNIFSAANRILRWDKVQQEITAGKTSFYIPVQYPVVRFISVNTDPHRLFNTNYLQQLHVWKDSSAGFQAELVTRFPDSNYVYGQKQFSGIVLVRDWQDHYLKEFLYEKNGKIGIRSQVQQPTTSNKNVNNLDEICFYSSGYNYAEATRSEYYYWEIELGCISYFGGGGSISTDDYSSYSVETSGSGGSATGNAADAPAVSNITIARGNNIIADIRDYNKCFDIATGSDHHYSVTVCVDQPIPYQRNPWGFAFHSGSGVTDFVSAGHTFLILTDQRSGDKITRNIGFYPASGADPISPADQGQLNNDAEHDYDIALTVNVTGSQFATILEFISHGNDAGYNYDLNSNNCSTFAINAIARAGIQLPVHAGAWPDGGGYDPGDLGEDIRNMTLTAGMSRSTNPTAHPNTGTCQ